ncbi:MAG: hypothetical protein WBL55_23295, partial [Xanthobacteraceae bacterium]
NGDCRTEALRVSVWRFLVVSFHSRKGHMRFRIEKFYQVAQQVCPQEMHSRIWRTSGASV